MPTLTQLEYLVAIDLHRHFAKAAQACFVTQPTLSMQLQKLEEELGCILFDRSKKPILPTEVGKKVIAQARTAIGEFKKITLLSKQDQKLPSGDFHLAVIPTLSPYLIPLFIEKFSNDYPKIELHIHEWPTETILSALEEDRLDAGLMATPLQIANLQETVLFYEPFFLYVRADHLLGRKKKVREQDLKGKEIWLLEEGHCLRKQVLKVCSLKGEKNVLKNIHFKSGNLETLKQMVSCSRGYTLIPYLACKQQEGLSSSIKIIDFEKPVPSREISLVCRRTDLKQPVYQALEKTILASLPAELVQFQKKGREVISIG